MRGLQDFLQIKNLTPVIRGPCDHARAEHRYRPSRRLRHLIRARNATCAAPGCGRRAARCDLDHTDPHHHGGRTCECNLAPLCRHHHRCKQAEGWRLEQPEPGILVWHTPGRTRLHHHPHPVRQLGGAQRCWPRRYQVCSLARTSISLTATRRSRVTM